MSKFVQLDASDKKILFELDFDSRASYAEIARKVGLSKQGVEYKIKRLRDQGVIRKFYPVINVPKLGYIYCRVMLTLKNLTEASEAKILNYLVGHKQVFWLFSMQGRYDLNLVLWAHTVTEFKEFIDSFQSQFGKNIKEKREAIATHIVHHQHKHLVGAECGKSIDIKETRERVVIDELDKRILHALCKDARSSFAQIAKEGDVSSKVVAYRVKRLESEKLIVGYRPDIDHNLLGLTFYKVFFHFNSMSLKQLTAFKAEMEKHPLVLYVIEGIGLQSDIDIEIVVESNQQLLEFIKDLRYRFPALIGEYETVIYVDTLKVEYLPF